MGIYKEINNFLSEPFVLIFISSLVSGVIGAYITTGIVPPAQRVWIASFAVIFLLGSFIIGGMAFYKMEKLESKQPKKAKIIRDFVIITSMVYIIFSYFGVF